MVIAALLILLVSQTEFDTLGLSVIVALKEFEVISNILTYAVDVSRIKTIFRRNYFVRGVTFAVDVFDVLCQ